MMDWHTPIDIYCERTGSGLWNEPLNALSNIAFPLAALWASRTMGRVGPARGFTVLVMLAAGVGIGSFLFHTFANVWSEWADVVPIWSFVALYIALATFHLGGASRRVAWAVGVTAAIAAVLTLVTTPAMGPEKGAVGLLNASEQYAPALLALVILAGVMTMRRHPARHWIIAATLVFVLALAARTVDPHLCARWPLGTHFLWHVMSAVVVGLLLRGLIRHRR